MNKTYQVVYENTPTNVKGSHVNVAYKNTFDEAIDYIESTLKANPNSKRVYHVLEQTSIVAIKHKIEPVTLNYTYSNDDVKESKEENNNG